MMFSQRKIELSTFYWLIFGLPLILIILVAPVTLKTTRETTVTFIQTISIAVTILFLSAQLLVRFAHENSQE